MRAASGLDFNPTIQIRDRNQSSKGYQPGNAPPRVVPGPRAEGVVLLWIEMLDCTGGEIQGG
ncbi:MAG: hypothetical protein LC646_10135, partial [Xanthomonadaceae bacterium]|nr:hypothetical protein [Xanthomonadaceae bacterium]